MPDVLLSIVIPVRGDARPLDRLLAQLPPHPLMEIIVSATAGDETARARGQDVIWVSGPSGRGVQLNAGAARATGRRTWFVHADGRFPGDPAHGGRRVHPPPES